MALFVMGAIPFIVVVRLGLRSPRVRASYLLQFAVFLLACLAAVGTIVVLGLLAVQQMFKVT